MLDARSAAARTCGAERASCPNLILGIIEGYTFYEISPFLRSLRSSSFEGHLCLYAGPNMADSTVAAVERLGAEVIRYRDAFPFVADPHSANVHWLPSPIHIYNYRHFLYLDYLLKHGSRFRSVLITDVRDVIFQADPFHFEVEDCICVAMENFRLPIGSCKWTKGWLLAGFGAEALDRVRDAEMSCAGTTLAPVVEMQRYLRTLLGMIQRMEDASACADQAAHNLLLHGGRLAPVKRLYNFYGPILTAGTEPEHWFNDRGELINLDGSVINIVHQYDRHPRLLRHFRRKIWPSRWQRFAARVGHRFQRCLARLSETPPSRVSRSNDSNHRSAVTRTLS